MKAKRETIRSQNTYLRKYGIRYPTTSYSTLERDGKGTIRKGGNSYCRTLTK